MIRLANVLIVDGKRFATDILVERLSRNGYHAVVCANAADALGDARAEHPDLVLIGDTGTDAVALGRALKADPVTADIPVLLLAETVTVALCRDALEAGLDDVIAWTCEDVELLARLRPLVRLATMHAELRMRAVVAKRLGVEARERVQAPAGARPVILVVGDEAGEVAAILGDEAEVTVGASLFDAEVMLEKRNFDAAVLWVGNDDAEGMLSFCSQVRNNTRLFNLPMVLLADAAIPAAEGYRRGATRVFTRPVDGVILRSALLTLVHRQQLRWSIRGAMGDSLKDPTRDPVAGSYSRVYLESYLDSRLTIARSQDRHLAVVFFYIPNVEGVRSHFGDDAALHLTQQLGQWITGLLRAEDLTACYAENKFCVVLPDTPLAEAEVVMQRIAGVLAYTDFAVREVYQPVKVWVQVASTDAQPGDDLAGLLARAQRNLD